MTHIRGYNVTIMTTITTKLIRDGNSMAVRIPKTILAMSGLNGSNGTGGMGGTIRMEAKNGQVI